MVSLLGRFSNDGLNSQIINNSWKIVLILCSKRDVGGEDDQESVIGGLRLFGRRIINKKSTRTL